MDTGRSSDTRSRATDRGFHRLIRENAYRDFWLLGISILVLLSLRGCGPLGIQGNDDIARDSARTAQDAKDLAAVNRRLVHDLGVEIKRNKLTRDEVRSIAREQSQPSTQQILKLLERATEVCARNPTACRNVTGQRRGAGTGTGGSSTRPGSKRPQSVTPQAQRRPARSPPRTRPNRPVSRPSPSPPPSSSPAPNPDPDSVVDVHTNTPLPHPPVCLDHLVEVDC